MSGSWTVKVAGVSGTGKTTVMEGLRSRLASCRIVIYSSLLAESGGDQSVADILLADILAQEKGLVIMDDHLEFDNPNKTENYRRENTRGIILLDVPLEDLLKRISLDENRLRKGKDPQAISRQLNISREKAMVLSRDTRTPLLVVPNLEGEVKRSISVIAAFIAANSP